LRSKADAGSEGSTPKLLHHSLSLSMSPPDQQPGLGRRVVEES
jgi:hypothetical protein